MSNNLKQISSILSKADKQTLTETQKQLAKFKTDLAQLYEASMDGNDADWRTGAETYGYHTEEQIKGDMDYISDRWRASFRIKWLIDFIDLPQEELQQLTNHD
jgi:hypothetical protein